MTVRFKPEVRVVLFWPPLTDILELAALWSQRERIDVEVNSIDDGAGVHQASSLHGLSLAVDLDTVGDKAADTRALADWLRLTLPTGYDIVLEGDHVHVEYDTHRPALRATAT